MPACRDSPRSGPTGGCCVGMLSPDLQILFKKSQSSELCLKIFQVLNVSDLFRNSGKACGSQCEQLRGLALACGLLACRAWAGLFRFLLAG